MKTYKITGSTNPWIANRDIHFNGKTKVTFESGLSYEEAHAKLISFCESDYEFTLHCSSKEEAIRNTYSEFIAHADELRVDFDEYFEKTKKRWLAHVELTRHSGNKNWYEGPGLYKNELTCVMLYSDDYYEYDSRTYQIEEENE